MRYVILVPGADALAFDEDLAEAIARQFETRIIALPRRSGHPVATMREYYEEVRVLIGTEVDAIRSADSDALIVAIGRNLGGSLLAYAERANGSLDALVILGAVPALSNYFLQKYRESRDAEQGRSKQVISEERWGEAAKFDLVESLDALRSERLLIQIGTRDEWINQDSVDIYKSMEQRFSVKWFDCGHSMGSSDAVAQRWKFIELMTGQSTFG